MNLSLQAALSIFWLVSTAATQAAPALAATVADPEIDFIQTPEEVRTDWGILKTEEILRLDLDVTGDGKPTVFLASRGAGSKAGPVWAAYHPTPAGYVRTNGVQFRVDFVRAGKVEELAPEGGLLLLWPGKGGGTLMRYRFEAGRAIQEEVRRLIYAKEEDRALFERVFGRKLDEPVREGVLAPPSPRVVRVRHIEARAAARADGSDPDPWWEISVLLWRKRHHQTGEKFTLAQRFAKLMDRLGKETAAYDPARLAALKPDAFHDRLRLIALDRVRQPQLYEEIFQTYLKHPSQEEIEKRRAATMQGYAGQLPQDQWEEMKAKVEKLNREHAPSLVVLEPPPVAPQHLTERCRRCFEYFWMSPPPAPLYRSADFLLEQVLDELNEKRQPPGAEADTRTLVGEWLKDFDPSGDPRFKVDRE